MGYLGVPVKGGEDGYDDDGRPEFQGQKSLACGRKRVKRRPRCSGKPYSLRNQGMTNVGWTKKLEG